jgi:heme exporter protein A
LDTDHPQLEARSLGIARGERGLIADLSFTLEPGQLGLVMGANGSGKTTLLRVLAGLSAPSSGSALWRSAPVSALAPPHGGEIAYQGHLDGLKKSLSVSENLMFYRRLWGSRCALSPLLEELRLAAIATLPVRALSAGQRRRLGLALLRVGSARVWILDEPTTNLDTEGRGLVGSWLSAHLAAGGLALVATHQPDEFVMPGALVIEL